jgi:hypothetical protein
MKWEERQVNLLPCVESNTDEAIRTLEMGYLSLIEGKEVYVCIFMLLAKDRTNKNHLHGYIHQVCESRDV